MAQLLELRGPKKREKHFLKNENVVLRGKRTGEKKEENNTEREYFWSEKYLETVGLMIEMIEIEIDDWDNDVGDADLVKFAGQRVVA